MLSVVAGTGTCASGAPSGDGSAATGATFKFPLRVIVAGVGNVHVLDYPANNVRRIDALTGIISTVAGSDLSVYTADGAPAAGSGLNGPQAIAVDSAGNPYIAKSNAQVVRKVDARTGLLSTMAGNYQAGYGYRGGNGSATSAQLNNPDRPAFGSFGSLFIADDANNAICKVTPSGVITTIAGIGPTYCEYSGDGGQGTSAEICNPEGVAIDAAGNVYIADSSNDLVRKVNAATGMITTVAGVCNNETYAYSGNGGSALKAGLGYLEDVALDNRGNLLIADSSNGVIHKVATGSALAGFDTTSIGSKSTVQDLTLTNDGNSALALSAITLPGDFNVGGADTRCTASTTLAAGASCVLGIKFLPTAAGALTGTITLTDDVNNSASTQSIALSGTGTALASQLAPAGISPTIAAGGNLGTVTASMEASSGAIVTGSTASVMAAITGPAGYSQVVTGTAIDGVATFNLTAYPLTTAATYTFTASSAGFTPASASSTVTAAQVTPSATQMAVSVVPASVSQGGNLGTVTATLETAASGVVTSPAVTITITGSGGFSAVVQAVIVNGIATFDLTGIPLSTPGSYSVIMSSPSLPSQTFPVARGQDFTLAPAPSSTSGSGIVPTQTVQPDSPAVYPLLLAPVGTIFNAAITLTATGLPPGVTYTFSPATVTPGSSYAATILTGQTVKTTVALDRQNGLGGTLGGLALATLLLPFAGSRKLRRAAGRMPLRMVAFTLLSLGAALGLTGCGVGGLFGHSPSTYTITVTGTSGSLSHSTIVNLTIQ